MTSERSGKPSSPSSACFLPDHIVVRGEEVDWHGYLHAKQQYRLAVAADEVGALDRRIILIAQQSWPATIHRGSCELCLMDHYLSTGVEPAPAS